MSSIGNKTFTDEGASCAFNGNGYKPFNHPKSVCTYENGKLTNDCHQRYLNEHPGLLENIKGELTNGKTSVSAPVLLLAFGGAGSGKSYLGDRFLGYIGLDPANFVNADVDDVLYKLPEYANETMKDTVYKGAALDCYGVAIPLSTQLITEFAESNYNLVMGPTARQFEKIKNILKSVDRRFDNYRKILLYVKTDVEAGARRAKERGNATGRFAVDDVWAQSYENVDKRWEDIVDAANENGIQDVYEVTNEDGRDIVFVKKSEEDEKRQKIGGSASAARHYVVTHTSIGAPGGRYSSKSGPAAAAKKAASQRFRGESNSKKGLQLTVRETGSDREFTYNARRVKLQAPFTRTINGKKIVSEYEVEVRAVKK